MTGRFHQSAICILAVCLLLWGCGDDDGGSPNPVTAVEVSPDTATLVTGRTLELTVAVTGGDDEEVDWYVNDVPNGNSVLGTVTGSSVATYAAPGSVPDPATVTVKAVSRENPSRMDSCLVTIEELKEFIYVNASTGDDDTGDGSSSAPLRSITAALEIAGSRTTVLVASGVYDADHGEVFPLDLPDSVSVVGEDPEDTIISGHTGEGFYKGTIHIGGMDTAFRKFTLEMGEPAGEQWRVPLLLYESEGALVDSVWVFERGYYGTLRLTDAVDSRIENCILVDDDGQTMGHGIELGMEYGNTIVRNCEIGGFYIGISIGNHSNPLIEGCIIENNDTGVNICCHDYENHDPNPDLGGGARGSAGGNTIRNNDLGLSNGSSHTILARFNTWQNDPPVDGEDFINLGTGSVIWE
jgi:hypothetical protein